MSTLSTSQQRALALIPKLSGGLSVICSSFIAVTILKRMNCFTRKNNTKDDNNNNNHHQGALPQNKACYQRLVLGISCADILTSLSYSMSTWPIPRDVTGSVWAVGNTATCTAQGFFIQSGVASPLYNVSLSIYFLMAVRQQQVRTTTGTGVGESQTLKRLEPFFHILPLLWGYGTGIVGLVLKIFNPANFWCWIADYPDRNTSSANIYRWALFYGPLWLGVLVVTVNLVRLFLYVRNLAKQSKKNAFLQSVGGFNNKARRGTNKTNKLEDNSSSDSNDSDSYYEDDDDDGVLDDYEEAIHDEEECHPGDAGTKEKQDKAPFSHPQLYTKSTITGTRRDSSSAAFSAGSMDTNGTSSHSHNKTAQALEKRRNKLVWQCLRYAMAFYATWLPITIVRIYQAVGKDISFPLLLLASICTPLQGLPNFLAYLYPRLVSEWGKQRQRRRRFCCVKHEEEEDEQEDAGSSLTWNKKKSPNMVVDGGQAANKNSNDNKTHPSGEETKGQPQQANNSSSDRHHNFSATNTTPSSGRVMMIRPDGSMKDQRGRIHQPKNRAGVVGLSSVSETW